MASKFHTIDGARTIATSAMAGALEAETAVWERVKRTQLNRERFTAERRVDWTRPTDVSGATNVTAIARTLA